MPDLEGAGKGWSSWNGLGGKGCKSSPSPIWDGHVPPAQAAPSPDWCGPGVLGFGAWLKALHTEGRTPNIHLPELPSTPQLHPLPQDSALRWNNFLVFQLPGGFPVTRSSWWDWRLFSAEPADIWKSLNIKISSSVKTENNTYRTHDISLAFHSLTQSPVCRHTLQTLFNLKMHLDSKIWEVPIASSLELY